MKRFDSSSLHWSLVVGIFSASPQIALAAHPMDPLSADEIRAAISTIRQDTRFSSAAIPFVNVQEPPKSEVLAWTSDRPVARQAQLMAVTRDAVSEVVVDLESKQILSVQITEGAQGPVTLSETFDALQIVLAYSEFRTALSERGIDLSAVFCAPWSAGNYDLPDYDNRRILMVGCFDTRRTTNNQFGWPIERLYAVVDLYAREVVRVIDNGIIPISEASQNFLESDIDDLRPPREDTMITQPTGGNVVIDGHVVRWGNWRFHVRIDPRVGPIVSLAEWKDGDNYRSVLYQGYLSEMFVPYMDPEIGWYSRTFFDVGEYGAGLMATRLTRGVDCPATAQFLDATLSDDQGNPMITPDAMCVFERDKGEPIWRHGPEGRKDVELVVRMVATVGNYDYLLDWTFNDAAEIDVRVGATGIVALKGVETQTMADATAIRDTRYGTLLSPGVVGTNHDHHFNFRLDLDVEDPINSFEKRVYEVVSTDPSVPRKSVYVVGSDIPETELAAVTDSGDGVRKLIVINENESNSVGNPVGYELLYANHGAFLLTPDDPPAQRARFLEHDLWITQYEPRERYAAGDYVFGSREPAGLPVWAQQDRPVRKQDIVVWVNLGMHHLTRSEDHPVMPTLWQSFKIRPFNFFDRNPAVDLRRELTSD